MKEFIERVKKTMKRYNAKHAVYGVVNWQNKKEFAEHEINAHYFYSDREFEDFVKYLKKHDGVQMVYAIHAQD